MVGNLKCKCFGFENFHYLNKFVARLLTLSFEYFDTKERLQGEILMGWLVKNMLF